MESLAESGAKQGARGFSDAGRQSFAKIERQETIGKPGTGMEETKIEIVESTSVEQGAGFNFNKLDENEQIPGARRQRENTKTETRQKDLKSLTIEMLIPKYSEGERTAFRFLHKQFTRSRKLPREWKCLMTYHRLAWNILSRNTNVIQLSGWQVQLIAWVFVCWQWKHLITTLVQNWHDLGVLKKWVMEQDIVETSGPSLREIVEYYMDIRWPTNKRSDTLKGDNAKKRKEDTIDNADEVEKTSDNWAEKNIRKISSEEDSKEEDTTEEGYVNEVLKTALKQVSEQKRGHILKIKGLQRSKKGKRKPQEQDDLEGVLKLAIRKVLQEEEVKDMVKVIIKEAFKEEKERETKLREGSTSHEEDNKGESSLQQGTTVKENQKAKTNRKNKAKDEEEREEWRKLKETLSRYNVSMDGIQAFQKFRFYCEPGHLSWPLPKQA